MVGGGQGEDKVVDELPLRDSHLRHLLSVAVRVLLMKESPLHFVLMLGGWWDQVEVVGEWQLVDWEPRTAGAVGRKEVVLVVVLVEANFDCCCYCCYCFGCCYYCCCLAQSSCQETGSRRWSLV